MRAGRFLSATLWFFIILGATLTAAAQSPFAGTWKLNQEKSQLAGDTLRFSAAAAEGIELSAGGVTYSFRTDGQNYAMPSGNVAIWRQTSPTTWTTEYRNTAGKLLSSDSWKLSADGKTLSDTTSGVNADGDLYTDTAEYERTAGDQGLIGAWKSTQVKLSSPGELSIRGSGVDGLVLQIPSMKITCEARFDGKEVAVQGPDVPTGLRVSFERTGPYSFRLVEKLNGSVISSTVYTVTEDRRTMTAVGAAPGDPPATLVWEKQ